MIPEAYVSIEEKLTSLFDPDTLLSAQYFDTFRRTFPLEPEKKLMLAVLEDTISCFQKYVVAQDRRGKRLFLETEAWILEEENDWVFSFLNICEVLGLSPGYIRDGLLRWKRVKRAEPSKAKIYRFHAGLLRRKRRLTVSRRTGHRFQKAVGR